MTGLVTLLKVHGNKPFSSRIYDALRVFEEPIIPDLTQMDDQVWVS